MENYSTTLDEEQKERYFDKLSIIGNTDPYCLKPESLSLDIKSSPDVTPSDVILYLVYQTSYYSMEQMLAYKSLEAYNFFHSGHVNVIGWTKYNEYDPELSTPSP